MADHGEIQGLRHHFVDMRQQAHAARLGIWIFIISELMLFGGMFTGYSLYRAAYPEAFALASNELNVFAGTINTVVLLLSSFTVVVALHFGRLGRQRPMRVFIVLTLLLGATFLGIKGWEYWHKWHVGHVPGAGFHWEGEFANPEHIRLFFGFYWVMTATHALHMLIGMSVWVGVWWLSRRGHYTRQYNTQIETTGLYWHFVDIVWIFLFPLLYLIGRHL